MTRAEERALEAYPTQDMYSSLLDGSNRLKREVFINGYEQAEKDLALTWKLIKAEIERLKNIAENNNASEYLRGQARVCRVILSFIDSLPDEKPSEDLEEVAARYELEKRQSILSSVDIVDAFIAGAEWMYKQMNNE